MPIKWFKMGDGELMETETVIRDGLAIDLYPTPYLVECASQREWRGKASTTQLIKGTREAYLQLVTDYAVDPDDQAFRIVGTRGHHKLELNADETMMAEMGMESDEVTGIADLLEPDPQKPGWHILTDYKVSGSYKVMKALGIVKKQRPMVDQDGNPVVYKKSGKWGKAGDPRKEDYYEADQEKRDIPEWDLQVNRYRIAAERVFGVKISRMRIFIPVRDGGTVVSKNRGIVRKTYSVPVPEADPAAVDGYFEAKRVALVGAMAGYEMSLKEGHPEEKAVMDNMPAPCSKMEAWDGRKCADFCDVAVTCLKAGNPHVARPEAAKEE